MLSLAAAKDPAMSGQLNYERREGDFYATPPENVDCLAHFYDLANAAVFEPACGEGHISKRLSKLGIPVISTDLFDRGYGTAGVNFLEVPCLPLTLTLQPQGKRLGIVTNPPYGDIAEKFVRHALDLTKPDGGFVAMFMRNEWDMSSEDRPDLFEPHPAYAMKICVTKRPRWIEGSKGSPRHNYAWYVWDWQHSGPHHRIHYIHPNDAAPAR